MALSTALIRGSTQLALDCVSGVTSTAQNMHRTIARTSTSWLDGISGFGPLEQIRNPVTYSVIRAVSDALNTGVSRSFAYFDGQLDLSGLASEESRWVSALNGVCGDHLEATDNVLALPMCLVTPSGTLDLWSGDLSDQLAGAGPNIVLMVHGLGLSEQNWWRPDHPDIGDCLEQELGFTPVYLRYNTGRHISTNGQELAGLLDDLCEAWPVPVESLSLVGHSMGGLVIRSACWYADKGQRAWIDSLRRVLFLGTPHHGSPLEKAGSFVEAILKTNPYAEPLMLGRKRSAGVKDLRYGNLLDEDWQDQEGEGLSPDKRQIIPLLPEVDYYFAAASLGSHEADLKSRVLGDLLVRLGSALGSSSDELRSLNVKPENCRIFLEKDHFDLLDDERVQRQAIEWFAESKTTPDGPA